ncbi:MAG TPA: four helix bundle protein [Bacteroidales bacterium]|jgi:four helix bundle protein|nr:four helix bundle protein [Bacteroidales bacterium]
MNNKEFSKQLQARTRTFAIRLIRLSANLPNTVEGKVVRNQITKAGSSVGANYREASRARSRADFKNKIKICESESDETLYWLEIIKDLEWVQINDEYKEANELLSISASIGHSLSS